MKESEQLQKDYHTHFRVLYSADFDTRMLNLTTENDNNLCSLQVF